MSGLRELWGLRDPAVPDANALRLVTQARQTFSDVIGRINQSLQYTAVNAQQATHEELSRRRDQLFERYQTAVAEITENSTALEQVLVEAERFRANADRVVDITRNLKQEWELQASQFESAEATVSGMEEATDAAPLQQGLDEVTTAVKRRDYQTALDRLHDVALDASHVTSAPLEGSPTSTHINEQRYPLDGALDQPLEVPRGKNPLENWQNPLINGDPRELFDPQKMDQVADMHFQGEGSLELNQAMEGLLFAEPGADISPYLDTIAKERNLDRATVQQQFERFQQLQQVAKKNETARDLPAQDATTPADQKKYLANYGDFLGSRSSLRFGQVVGEATGLDPAFASMLNPTGGMVGPGMDLLAPVDANSPIILHGIFHDAGGYLLNYQNTGPGYTYLTDKQPESGKLGADPYQGQVEGVSYWYERRQPDRSVLKDLYAADGEQMAYDAYVSDPIADSEQFVRTLTDEAVNEVSQRTLSAGQDFQQSVSGLKNTVHIAGDAVQQQVVEADQQLNAMAEKARALGVDDRYVTSLEQSVREQLGGVSDQVKAWEQGAASTFDLAGASVDENLQAVNSWTQEAGALIQQRTEEAAVEAEQAIHEELVELARNSELQETLRRGINFYCEAKQSIGALVDEVNDSIIKAQAQVHSFFDQSVEALGQGEQLSKVKDGLIDKLAQIQLQVVESVKQTESAIDQSVDNFSETRQEILDVAVGLSDPLLEVVSGGTDVIANTLGAATDFAAERLDRLTNVLG